MFGFAVACLSIENLWLPAGCERKGNGRKTQSHPLSLKSGEQRYLLARWIGELIDGRGDC